MFSSQKFKFSKTHRNKVKASKLLFGSIPFIFGSQFGFYIYSTEFFKITDKQLLTTLSVVKQKVSKSARFRSLVFFNRVATEKGSGSRIGKGKGSFAYLYCIVKPGDLIMHLDNISFASIENLFIRIQKKLSGTVKFFYYMLG